MGVDWNEVVPEQLRGVKAPTTVNWEALRMVFDRSDMTPKQRERKWKELERLVKYDGVKVMHPLMRKSYCCARLVLGDFSDYWGWEFRDFGNKDDTHGWAADVFWLETSMPKWGGGYVDKLLVMGEQGIGDEIFWASMLPECLIRAKQVIYECDPRLHSLLERSLPGLKCEAPKPFETERGVTAFIPAAELMRMFRRHPSHFPKKPYIKPDEKRVAEFERYIGRTGIAWKGRQGKLDRNDFAIDMPVSLQYGDSEDVEKPPINLKDDIEGLVALCSVLDKVITVPQSVLHFAGSQGVQVEVVIPPDNGEEINQIRWDVALGKSRFYPNVEVFKDLETWKRRT